MTEIQPLAVVTGASSGVGFELAKLLADHGFDLLITAPGAGLERAGQELRAGGVGVQVVHADLTAYEGVEHLNSAIIKTGRPVAVAALNAGVAQGGAFIDTDLDDELEMIDLNVTSTVHLTKFLLKDMIRRNDGRLLITSSVTGTVPGAKLAVYDATTSFLHSFAESLQEELAQTAITVTSLMPGSTDTEVVRHGDPNDTPLPHSSRDHPAQVAQQGFEALMAGRDQMLAGALSTEGRGLLSAVLPDVPGGLRTV
ncbi:MAG: SDR family NAD(P)-dependent oxidoreductase [Propionibacteriaceae bacterium]